MDCTFASAGVEFIPLGHRHVTAARRCRLIGGTPFGGVGQARFGLGHEMRLIQGIRVALDVIHQLGNLLFSEQVESEVACQVSESESNARICQ